MTIRVMVHREVHNDDWYQCNNCKSEMLIGYNDFNYVEIDEDSEEEVIGVNCPVCNAVIQKREQWLR